VSRLALLYDVHGNLPALEAVLGDARAAGAERFLLGGDYAVFGPLPAETLGALRAIPQATWIRGNVDRWCAHPEDLPAGDELVRHAVADCRAALDAETVEALGSLPEQLVLDGTRYCHASPISDMRSFMPDPGDDDDELLAGVAERRVVFGHTHLAFRRRRPDGVELLNPGSVGMPLDGDTRASYVLVSDDGSVDQRRVSYDSDLAVSALERRFGDAAWARRSVRRLQTAKP
jgi:predicted phosphodiesterase